MNIEDRIFWIGHASFYIKTDKATIFIDPFKVSSSIKEKADLIIITHPHMDHCSIPDIEKVMKKNTKFILANKCLDNSGYDKIATAEPGFKTNFNGIEIEAVHAYNNKKERLQFHPSAENWVGYIITVDGKRIYHAGDTDHIPEMKKLKKIDLALLPMGGMYTMAIDEAIEAANAIAPKSVVPMHYKILLGKDKSIELEKKVKSDLDNAMIMKEVQEPVYSF
jgi:L-ascorbate metabolism protein UlaG (beta-lactamase superfamily)